MQTREVIRMAVDLGMTVLLLLLMGYSRVGETAHEWLGIAMFALFTAHHILNRSWIRHIGKGRYTPYRVFQTFLAALIFLTMLGSMGSGILLSKHVFTFLSVCGVAAAARTVHHLCGYWNSVLLSVHIGLHGSMMLGAVNRRSKTAARAIAWINAVLAAYGVYAFIKRQLGAYLTGQVMFSFFDYNEPLPLFLLDYLAIMALFTLAGYALSALLKKAGANRKG